MIAATLQGPNYFAVNHDESSIEMFADIGGAVEALLERYASNGAFPCDVLMLDCQSYSDLFPVLGEGTFFQCYEVGDYADFPVFTEDKITEVLTAVHSGAFDWTVTLRDIDGTMTACVVNTAIQ